MDVDEVPAAGGSRPDWLSPVSGPQERVQRHNMEQLVEPAGSRCSCAADGEPAAGVPEARRRAGHAQDLWTPHLCACRSPSRRWWLVEVPVHELVLVARGTDFTGTEWFQYVAMGGTFWCMGRTTERPFGVTASPGRDINTGQG